MQVYHSPRYIADITGWKYHKVLRWLRQGKIKGINIENFVWIITDQECERIKNSSSYR